jgi:hypothetical protein
MENSQRSVIVASRDERGGACGIDPTTAPNIAEVRDRVRAEGIILGGTLQPTPRSGNQNCLASPVEIIVHDEYGTEHRLIADYLEEYSLSSGSTLYYLYISAVPSNCRWLVGRALEVSELTRTKALGEKVATK